ncbi:SET domain containing protein [Scophthalmus maximus]|uniref:SET domain containing protein n=1 Tax=Scophthalmus maximus TaxID=52904 RepID=A0A2U9B163_SCOMX|nr:SET domain containing protein [Scophthalmus maximus]
MAENVRSPFDYREPPTLDSDGDGSKPPPPRGRVCGRKRKGTPVKVCDRVYVTEDEEEESMSEHSYSPGEGQYPEGAEDRLAPPGSPYYLPDPAQLCVPELGEEGASGVRGPVLFHPPPNCRIREVHCGTQVRLVVIAIRDIAKGEEITVDYSLTDWGENAMVMSRRQHCPYCGRHYRSLARHLEKHHANQPEVRTAMELAHLHPHSSSNGGAPHPQPSSSSTSATQSHSFAVPQPSASNPPPPPLFSRERESPATRSSTGAVSFSLSLSPPASGQPAATKKGPSLSLPATKRPAAPTVSRVKSPSPPPPTTPRRGRRLKREKQEEQQKVEVESPRSQEELVPPPTPEPDIDPEEELELSGEGEEDAAEEKNGEIISTQRHHMSPLLSSLSCLVLFLRRQQHSSFLSLTRSPHSAEAWRLLCHSSLSLLILYNRHRECEMAKLTIQDYRDRTTPQAGPSTSAPTGTEALLSPFERQVLCHLPRASVLGKRGRVQPLILPPHCESCLDLLLQTSPNVGVDPESPYVFSRPYHSPATPLRGTDLLRNLARASGAKNPSALTATRVRRQVAILTQLILLEEGEGQVGATKRLEEFLEREYHVTQNCSAIIRDPALMGRVGRVVLYGEREGVLFRGMSLQHICLELDVMSGNSGESFSEDSEAEEEKEEVKEKPEVVVKKKGPGRPPRKRRAPNPSAVSPSIATVHKRRCIPPKSGKRGVLKRPWSEAERVAVETHLKRNLMELRVPAKADCERCLELCPLLVSNQRDWRSIKFYVHNRIQLLKKQGRRESAAAVC